MKKLLNFFGVIALVAGFATSCKEEENKDNENDHQKKLVKVVDNIFTYEFNYDNDGRCVSLYSYINEKEELYYKGIHKYDGNTIRIESYYTKNAKDPNITTVTLNSKGYLESREFLSGKFKYEYDDQGHLIAEYHHNTDGSVDTIKYEWENGNLVKKYDDMYVFFYKYTNSNYSSPIENKSRFHFFDPYSSFDGFYDFLLGEPCKNILVSLYETVVSNGSGGSVEWDDLDAEEELPYQWVLDKDGYPVKMQYENGSVQRRELYWE